MPGQNHDELYLVTIKNPLVYQDDLLASSKIILRDCALGLHAGRAGLWVFPLGETVTMTCLALFDAATGTFESGSTLSEADYPRYFEALRNGRVIDAVDTFADSRTNELAESYLKVLDVRSLLDATIRNASNGQIRGVLCVESVGEQRNWTSEEKMFVASMGDLLSQRLIANEWSESEERYRRLFEGSNEGILMYGSKALIGFNPAACTMFAGDADELAGKTPVDLSPAYQPDGQESEAKARGLLAQCLESGSATFEWRFLRLDGTEFDAEVTLTAVDFDGENTVFGLLRDVTAKLEAARQARIARQEVEYRAAHDSLTGLRNRDQLHRHVSDLIDGSPHFGFEVALFLLDLNRFKEINDTLGHSVGDKVLVTLAQVLNTRLSTLGGSLFRLGGDEFVVAFDSDSATLPFNQLPDEIRACLSSSIEIGGASFEMAASIGAASYPRHGEDSHELLRCADVAMYHAKKHDGVSPWYAKENDLHDKRRLAMVGELRQAIREDQFVLHYQPRINIATGSVTGCEALLRWYHPDRGLIPPNEFLAVAEMTELIHPLTGWVIDHAFDQIERLNDLGLSVPVAINLSARNLPDTQLFDHIEARIARAGIAPDSLEVEITESALINNPQRALDNLNRLDELGVSIAIDDFGTGYSSLSLLKELPLDTLKIDRSFVNDMLKSSTDHAIVSSTIGLARNFSASVIAEGVENQATLDALRVLDCGEAQGYFIARPMPAADLEVWLSERRCVVAAAAPTSPLPFF